MADWQHPGTSKVRIGSSVRSQLEGLAAVDLAFSLSTFCKGGFTGAIKIAHMSDSFGMRAQVHGMGLENAQLCAAITNNDYYEQLVMDEDQIKGMANLGPLSIVDGYLNVSTEPGLGYQFDWAELDRTAKAKITVTERFS